MNEIFLLLSTITVCGFLYFFSKSERDVLKRMVDQYIERSREKDSAYIDSLTKLQIQHFATLEKTSAKHLDMLNKQLKEFTSYLHKMSQPQINHEKYKAVKNEIDKKDPDEIPITEETRIPIVNGVKVKFEDEEEILTPSIS